MLESTLLQRQLEILRALRVAAAQRAQAEAAAEARLQAEQRAADATLSQAQQTAAAWLAEADKAQELGRIALKQARLGQLADRVKPATPTARAGADLAQELDRAARMTVGALEAIETEVKKLRRQRLRRIGRNVALIAVGLAIVALLVVAGPKLRLELLYRSASAALKAEQWDQGQTGFQQVIAIDSSYKDAQTLLRESYYQPAVVALEAEDWEQARAELLRLITIDSGYRDVQTLLCESYYRPAVAAIETEQWDTAAQVIVQLQKLDPVYRDVPDRIAAQPELRQAIARLYAALWFKGPAARASTFSGGPGPVRSLAFSPDGKTLAAAGTENKVRLWDVASGQELNALNSEVGQVTSVAFSSDGQILASGGADSTVKLWDTSTGLSAGVVSRQELHTLRGHTGQVWSIAFSPNGRALASGSADKTVRLWDTSTGLSAGVVSDKELNTCSGHSRDVLSVAFAPDGQTLASSSSDKTIRLWRTADGRPTRILSKHTDAVESVGFAPDGRVLVSASDDRTVKLWNLTDGQELYTLNGHTDSVHSVTFAPSGQLLASGGADGSVKLWNAAGGQELYALDNQATPVYSAAFSPDGRLLAVGDEAGRITLWTVRSESAEAIVPLTPTPVPTDTPTATATPRPTATPTPPTPTLTPTPVPEAFANVAKGLNVRRGPGTVYSIVTVVPQGARLIVGGRNPECTWWWVTIPNDGDGWVSIDLLKSNVPKCNPAPTAVPPTPTPTPTATRTPTPTRTRTPKPTPVPTRPPWRLIGSSKDQFSGSQGANGWAYMWEGYGGRGSFHWRAMPGFDGRCWRTESSENDIRICEGGEVHPGWASNIAYQWNSSVGGTVRVKTHFHKIDTRCGDGVELAVYRGTQIILPHQWIGGGNNQGRDNTFDVQVSPGDLVYFVITIHGEPTCDQTRVYLEIYQPQ